VSNESTIRLETLEPGHPRVVLIDYAPFDDILEMDIEVADTVRRRLIDHPDHIWIDDREQGGRVFVFIESPDDFVSLVESVSVPERAKSPTRQLQA
jgi:hypothetical protein